MTGEDSPVTGFIDLGTNSARLLVVRLNPNHSFAVLTRQKELVRLGEGEFGDDTLTHEAIERTVLVLTRFAEIARTFGAGEIIAVATSATRDARNRDELISRVHERAGLDLRVISGVEEARLIWLGVSGGLVPFDGERLFIDIGGGSTEIIIGDQMSVSFLRSLKLGAIRTTGMFIPPDHTGPVPGPVVRAIRLHIRDQVTHVVREVRKKGITGAVGSSGTIGAIESVAACMKDLPVPHRPGFISISELSRVSAYLSSLTLKERREVPGLTPARADIIIAGSLILESFLSLTGISSIEISSRGLRDGMLADYLSRIPGFPHAEALPVRETSIRQLGRSCQIDEAHADRVTAFSLSLFDSAEACGLHTLSERSREILAHAAYLHDTGQFISFTGHHQHSFYLITHAPLLGFHEDEILRIALLSRYHRKRMPRPRDPGYRGLDGGVRREVQILSVFLRMAENLDRSHDGRVEAAFLSRSGKQRVVLTIRCRSDCTLEEWALAGDSGSFEQVFGRPLEITVRPAGT